MASPLSQAGALTEPSLYAPLHTNRIFTGLWTNRSALRDAATSYLQEKYYSASRQDSIIAGVNTEVSSRLTLVRRPGTSVYNAQTFPPINRFYEFRMFSTEAESIKVMADTAASVYDATGPNTAANIWTKTPGAGKTSFQSVGNTLYMGNGLDQKKWVQSVMPWTPRTSLRIGSYLIDPTGNVQAVAANVAPPAPATPPTVFANLETLTNWIQDGSTGNDGGGTAVPDGVFTLTPAAAVGQDAVFSIAPSSGYKDAYWHNYLGIFNDAKTFRYRLDVMFPTTLALTDSQAFEFELQLSRQGLIGNMAWQIGPLGARYFDYSAKRWNVPPMPIAFDPTLYAPGKFCSLESVFSRNADNTITHVSLSINGTVYPVNIIQPMKPQLEADYLHAAFQLDGDYSADAYAVHVRNMTVTVSTGDLISAPGQTGATPPTWNPLTGGTTLDGGITWQNKSNALQNWGIAGPAAAPTLAQSRLPPAYPAWSPNTLYSSSLLIVDAHNNIQRLTQGGVTGAAEPSWGAALGAATADGGAVWTNQGTANWQAGHSYPVGAIVSQTFTYYVTTRSSGGPLAYNDYGGGATFQREIDISTPITVTAFFTCTTAGTSGATPPTWVDGTGLIVTDGSAVWTNSGPVATWAATVGPGTAISLAQTVIDDNGNVQNIAVSGKSGAAHPVWAAAAGSTTYDGSAAWIAGGPYSAASTQPWGYYYAFGNSVTGEISNASPASSQITLASNSLVNLQGPGSTDPQVDTIYIYRTAQGGYLPLLLDRIAAPAAGQLWSYSDTNPDTALNPQIQAATALQLTPPPPGSIAPVYHLQRVFVAVGNVIYWSLGPDAVIFAASGNSGFPPANSIVYPSRIVRMWPCAVGLIVFTVSDTYLIRGSATATDPLYTIPLVEGTGLLSYDGFCVNGSTPYLLTNSTMIVSLDPSAGVTEVGFPVADIIERHFDADSHLTFHSQTSADTALYAGDGLLGWYRMGSTTAPESGFSWSPQALITGGCRALRSVETSPGLNQLLMAPLTGGPILCRDRNANTDNGTPYIAQTIFGSIVLAQPGQLAGIQFISLDSILTGERPTLGVLLGEISGQFEPILRTRQDPPNLPPSATLYADRYAMAQNEMPVWCRHFQLEVNWPAEDAANELLTFTIFGALANEFKSQ